MGIRVCFFSIIFKYIFTYLNYNAVCLSAAINFWACLIIHTNNNTYLLSIIPKYKTVLIYRRTNKILWFFYYIYYIHHHEVFVIETCTMHIQLYQQFHIIKTTTSSPDHDRCLHGSMSYLVFTWGSYILYIERIWRIWQTIDHIDCNIIFQILQIRPVGHQGLPLNVQVVSDPQTIKWFKCTIWIMAN